MCWCCCISILGYSASIFLHDNTPRSRPFKDQDYQRNSINLSTSDYRAVPLEILARSRFIYRSRLSSKPYGKTFEEESFSFPQSSAKNQTALTCRRTRGWAQPHLHIHPNIIPLAKVPLPSGEQRKVVNKFIEYNIFFFFLPVGNTFCLLAKLPQICHGAHRFLPFICPPQPTNNQLLQFLTYFGSRLVHRRFAILAG